MTIVCSHCGKEVDVVCSSCWRCKDCKDDFCRNHMERTMDGSRGIEISKKNIKEKQF